MKKRMASILLALCVLFSISQSAFAYSTVQNGSTGNDVRTLQTMLNTVQNAGLKVDGIFGSGTKAAVRKFQTNNGLSVDGICGPKTWDALTKKYNAIISPPSSTSSQTTVIKSYPMVQYGSSGDAVKTLQTMLNKVSNAGLKVDGIFGAGTQAAVKKYQSSKGLAADGICGPNTWSTLQKDYGSNVPPVSSSITIGSGNYKPGTLSQGKTYSISGTITSTYNLKSVTIGIYNSNGSETSSVKTVYPNSTSYNIHNVDSYIKFGVLSGSESGTRYYFKVTAVDAKNSSKILVNNEFVVKSNNTGNNTNNNKLPLSASSLNDVQGCKMYRNTANEGLCTTCATVTLLRRKQYVDNKPLTFNFGDGRVSLGANVADIDRGDYYSLDFPAANNSYTWKDSWTIRNGKNTTYTTGVKSAGSLGKSADARKESIVKLLKYHPEGIVVYSNYKGGAHAIVISDYTKKADGSYQFYAYDPANINNGYSYRMDLGRTYLASACGGVNAVFNNLYSVWYVK